MCDHAAHPCSCGLNNRNQRILPFAAKPDSEALRYHMLRLQPNKWLCSNCIDAFMRQMKIRQRSIEQAGLPCLQVLYLPFTISHWIHPNEPPRAVDAHSLEVAVKSLKPAAILANTGCSRCCLDQDNLILVFNTDHTHWVCVMLNLMDCSWAAPS